MSHKTLVPITTAANLSTNDEESRNGMDHKDVK